MSGLSTWYLPGKIMTHWNFPLMRPQKYKSSHIALLYKTSSALLMAEAAHQKPSPTKNPTCTHGSAVMLTEAAHQKPTPPENPPIVKGIQQIFHLILDFFSKCVSLGILKSSLERICRKEILDLFEISNFFV